jgi:bacterioferritin-associated ferredoxin
MVRNIDYIGFMIVCICNRITEAEVRKAARAGAPTPETAYACVGCEVQCGCCLDYAREIIEEERADLLKVDAQAA